ncbi:Haloacid dehalogenase-like hydrolase domain-containing protein 2-like [Arapaima gigas]
MDIEHGKFSKVLKGSMQTYSEVGFLWLLKVPLTARGEEDCFAWEFTHLWRVGTMATRRQLKAVLVDLSGTLHIEDSAVPGAQEALARLRHAPMTVRFVTNTTKESRRMLVERLRRLNFHIDEHEIFTSLSAARRQVERVGVRPLLLLDDRALEDFAGIETSDPNAVVVGLAPEHFNYQMLNKAFRLLLEGAPLIAIHKARYYKSKEGLALGPGPFVTGLEYATDTHATVVGKPEKTFFLEALQEVDCQPEEAVMIGDDARDDVGGAQNSGMLGILVKTGKYRPGDEAKINPPPHVICDSFPQAVDHILQHLL